MPVETVLHKQMQQGTCMSGALQPAVRRHREQSVFAGRRCDLSADPKQGCTVATMEMKLYTKMISIPKGSHLKVAKLYSN
jgi:hypothetical protein